MPVLAMVNGNYESGDYQIKTGDIIEIPSDYTLDKVIEFMGISPDNLVMTVNGNEAYLDYKLHENDVIELGEVEEEKPAPKNDEMAGDKLLVIVNDKPVVMSGKASYTFVDVFDYIDFDTSKVQGAGIATIVNGKDAIYTQTLHAGDKIEIYWK
jgi:sulfur carrier protein ThiS